MAATTVQERLTKINAAFEEERRNSEPESYAPRRKSSGNGPRKSVQFSARPTVVFDSVFKSFGQNAVLRNINITIKESTIYGLYGASGSGKTTALSCLLGIQALDSGTIFVRGFRAGCRGSGVPGKRIGFMPQSLALHELFTLRETLHYFGKFYGMKFDDVESKRKYFVTLLGLENCDGQIRHFRSDEKQLVSFIVALIHEPEILVMDEPTLSMDPLARETVWKHIRELVAESKTTVIIASASAYEISVADVIGILRSGRLISEASPSALIAKHPANCLEGAILKICQEDHRERSSQNRWNSIGVDPRAKSKDDGLNFSKPISILLRQSSWNVGKRDLTRMIDKLVALVLKNVLLGSKMLWLILILMLLPSLTIYVVSISLTFAPRDLKFGFVSNDTGIVFGTISDSDFQTFESCADSLSCQFFSRLQRESLDLIPYASEDDARTDVLDGIIYGYLTILSESTNQTEDANSTNQELLKVILDTTNVPVASWLKNVVSTNFHSVVFNYPNSDTNFRNGPILFESATFGRENLTPSSFIVPGVTIQVITFYASLVSAIILLSEKQSGKFERIAAIGVYHFDILLAHLCSLTFLLFFQTLFAYITIICLLNVPTIGSVPLAFTLTLTEGICGIAFGVLVAAIFKNGPFAVLFLVAAAVPTFLISGTIVPLEGFPLILKYVGYVYPGTLSSLGLKSILLKGWGLSRLKVWIAFASSIAFAGAFVVFTFIYHLVVTTRF